jgi:hypothetical protein
MLQDTTWSAIDQNSSDAGMSDCIIGSESNTASGLKYGCNLGSNKTFSFVPRKFIADVTLQNANAQSFTYIDESGGLAADANLVIYAVLEDNVTAATNYTDGCFAKDIELTFANTPALIAGKTHHYVASSEMAAVSDDPATDFKAKTLQSAFTNGVARPVLGINFARDAVVPQNPFDLDASGLNIDINDSNGVGGSGYRVQNGNARFYYGRLYAPDYLSILPNDFKTKLFYEVYCDINNGCDKVAMGLGGLPEGPDHVDWFVVNSLHDATLGSYATSSVSASTSIMIETKDPYFVELNATGLQRAHCTRVSFNPDAWLQYDRVSPVRAQRFSYKSCFVSQGNWSGKGDVGMTVDDKISKKRNSRVDW